MLGGMVNRNLSEQEVLASAFHAAANALSSRGARGTATDRSGTATAVTAVVAAANPDRIYFLIQNLSTEIIYVKIGASATTTSSIALSPASATAVGGGIIWEGNFIPTESINVRSTSGSAAYVAVEA